MLEQLSAADFETLPDRRLAVAFGNADTLLEIKEIRHLRASESRPAPPFALLLRDSGAKISVPQGTYVYRHPIHGPLELFTVPIGPDGNGMCYEIIFN